MSNSMIFMLLVIQIAGMCWAFVYLARKGASGNSVRTLVIYLILLVLWITLWPLLFVRVLLTRRRDV